YFAGFAAKAQRKVKQGQVFRVKRQALHDARRVHSRGTRGRSLIVCKIHSFVPSHGLTRSMSNMPPHSLQIRTITLFMIFNRYMPTSLAVHLWHCSGRNSYSDSANVTFIGACPSSSFAFGFGLQ